MAVSGLDLELVLVHGRVVALLRVGKLAVLSAVEGGSAHGEGDGHLDRLAEGLEGGLHAAGEVGRVGVPRDEKHDAEQDRNLPVVSRENGAGHGRKCGV